MGLLGKILGYGEIKEPEFTKEFNVEDNIQLTTLLTLLEQVTEESKIKIERELLNVRSGLSGEKNVYYELKNSRLPIVCLHDIRLEHKGYEAQFDFIVIASGFILVIETKKMFGNIAIDNEGNFTREYQFKNRTIKEGMYSPITQNERHVRLLDEFLKDHKLIKHSPIYSLIVIANDKTIVNKKYAKSEVKALIIKHDQLTEKLNEYFRTNEQVKMRHIHMREVASTILNENKPIDYDFIKKLALEPTPLQIEKDIKITDDKPLESQTIEIDSQESSEKSDQSVIYKKLKEYRYKKSKELNVKAYIVFNNNELEELITNRPQTKDDFIAISGFGEKKYDLYGSDIAEIIRNTTNELIEELKKYRLEKSKSLNIKAYEIFTNKQLDEFIGMNLSSLSDLSQVQFFKEQQFNDYGNEIYTFIKNYF